MSLRAFAGERAFKNAVTVFLAGLTFVASLIVGLNVAASYRGGAAGRDSRILGIRYLTHLSRSLWEGASEKRLMIAWEELKGLMLQAAAYEEMASGKQADLSRETGERLARIQELLSKQGQVTRPPYFNPPAAAFDYFRYFLDKTFIPATELLERQSVKKHEGAFWGAKNDAYTTGLAVMSVAAFLLTLSLVVSGRIRFLMAGTGFLLVVAIVAVSAVTAAGVWKAPKEGSVALLARAKADLLRAQLTLNAGNDLAGAGELAAKAQADMTEILAADPDYGAAQLVHNRALALRGQILFFKDDINGSRRVLTEAAEGMKRSLAARREDEYLRWSLGATELFLDRNDAALLSIQAALAALPDRSFFLGVLKSLALLAKGDTAASGTALDAAIGHALAHPLASDPSDFRTLIKNLERWNEVRPVDGLPAAVKRLKEAAVSIAALKKALPEAAAAEVVSLKFVSPRYDRGGNIVDVVPCEAFPASSASAHFLVELKEMKKDESVVTKVFFRSAGQVFWNEQFRLGKAQHWSGPNESGRLLGHVEYPMPEAGEVLGSGNYRLEIYLGGNLAAAGAFKVL
jgi:hypothetical protein